MDFDAFLVGFRWISSVGDAFEMSGARLHARSLLTKRRPRWPQALRALGLFLASTVMHLHARWAV